MTESPIITTQHPIPNISHIDQPDASQLENKPSTESQLQQPTTTQEHPATSPSPKATNLVPVLPSKLEPEPKQEPEPTPLTTDPLAENHHPDTNQTEPAQTHPVSRPRRVKEQRKKNQILQILFASVSTIIVMLFALWYMDFLSAGTWHSHPGPNRVIFSGLAFSTVREELLEESSVLRPTFVVFYSENCQHCKKMRVPFLSLSNAFPHATFLAVSLAQPSENNGLLAKHFGVTHVPTLFFAAYGPDGEGKAAMKKVKYTGPPKVEKVRKFIVEQLALEEKLQEERNVHSTPHFEPTTNSLQDEDIKEL